MSQSAGGPNPQPHADDEAALNERRMTGTLAGLSSSESPVDLPNLPPHRSTSGGQAGSGAPRQEKAAAGRSSSGRNRSAVNYTLLAGRKGGGSGGTPKRSTPNRTDGLEKPPRLSSSKVCTQPWLFWGLKLGKQL